MSDGSGLHTHCRAEDEGERIHARETNGHYRRRRKRTAGEGEGRLLIAAILCLLACAAAFAIYVVVPIYQAKAERARDKAQQTAQQAAGQRFVHNFDCTYGTAIRLTLGEAKRSWARSAKLALDGRHAALSRGDKVTAHRLLLSYRNASSAATKYAELSKQLKPLSAQPCPS